MGIVGGKKIKVGKWHEMPRKLIHYFKPTLRGLGVLWVNISNVWDISGTVEKIYFLYALKVTRPKHRFFKNVSRE